MGEHGGATKADYERITRIQKHVWATGDFHKIAVSAQKAAWDLVSRVNLPPKARVLDVACSSGNLALVAATRYCKVTGIDYLEPLLERGRMRAQAEGLEIEFVHGDIQSMPFADASFDFVLSTFGCIFGADQEATAREMFRVCRPGGVLGLANWKPSGAGQDMLDLIANYAVHPPGARSSTYWGTPEGIKDLLGDGAASIETYDRQSVMYFTSVPDFVELYIREFGPVARVYRALSPERRETFVRQLAETVQKNNLATDGTLAMASDYVEVIVKRR